MSMTNRTGYARRAARQERHEDRMQREEDQREIDAGTYWPCPQCGEAPTSAQGIPCSGCVRADAEITGELMADEADL